jgi:hypothetical protein
MARKRRTYETRTYDTMVVCKCPKCEVIHKIKMYWTGKGMPKIYCDKCMPVICKIETCFEGMGENKSVTKARWRNNL